MAKILLVEDDYNLAIVLLTQLEQEQLLVDAVRKGFEALAKLKSDVYDLVILDWMLPDISGLEVCKQYRERGGSTPILMLTGKDTVDDKAAGLDAGADDYLVKPFHPTELSARIRALLRRPMQVTSQVIKIGDLELDGSALRVTKAGKEIELTQKEFKILELLMRHPNKNFTPEAMLIRAWDSDSSSSIETIRTHIKTLRKKIDSNASEESTQMIRTTRGLGYRIVTPQP